MTAAAKFVVGGFHTRKLVHRNAQDSLPTSLDAYVAGAIRSMDLPGAAIAVVKDGRIIVAKGYGVARREP